MAVPMISVTSANPFSSAVDNPPRLVNSTAPRKVELRGKAVIAAYIDARGDCLGAVPLELPFPGMTSAVLSEFTGGKFEPAQVGKQSVPSWVVIELQTETKLKEAKIISQDLSLPDRTVPPAPAPPTVPRPSGQLTNLPFSPASSLSESALPKRVRIKLSSRTNQLTIRTLVHITADGRCDRYVPLEMESGLDFWLANFLASWSLHPAQREGSPVDSWAVYTARVEMKFGSIDSGNFGVARNRDYDPQRDS
jgi:hypothetical protein